MSATVEEYHPEVAAFLERLRENCESPSFVRELTRCAQYSLHAVHREVLIQLLLSECATPLPRTPGVAS